MPTTEKDASARRIVCELTPDAAAELDRLRAVTGLSTQDIFRFSFILLRICVNAQTAGQQVIVSGKAGDIGRIRPLSARRHQRKCLTDGYSDTL